MAELLQIAPVLDLARASSSIAATLPLYVSGYVLGLLTVAFYFGVFAMAWDLLFGFAGEVNFGPTFLIGVGAYTAGILNDQFGWSVYLCIVLGALAVGDRAASCWRCRRCACAGRISA